MTCARYQNLTVGGLIVEDAQLKALRIGGDPFAGTAGSTMAVTDGGLAVGTWASLLKGSGYALATATPNAARFFADDNGLSIADSVANMRARTLLTVDQTGGSIRSVQGQLKMATGVDLTSGIYTAVQGYVEMAGTHSAKTGSTFSCMDASMEIGTALTVDSGGEMCGIHVETTGAGTITNSGTCAGVLIDKASGAAKWPDGILILGSDVIMGMRIGKFASSAATTSAVPFNTTQNVYGDGQLSTMEVHGSSASNLTSAYAAKVGRFRHVVNIGASGACAHETYGVMGQLVVSESTLQHLHSGLIGTFEGHTSGVVLDSAYTLGGHAAVMARIGGHAAITATTPLAGFLAFNNGSAALASGSSIAFLASAFSTSYPWTTGISLPRGSVTTALKIGAFAASAATTGGILFSTAQNIYGDGQLSTCDIHAASSSNLTSAYAAKVIRARHLVNIGTHGNVAHETYGVMGQLVVSESTLQHLHAGVIGTLEGHTSGVVVNGTYAYGAAAVMARVGGGAAITATKSVCGMVSFWNGAALASGKSIGFGNCYLTTPWTYGFANAVGSVVADFKLQAEDTNGLHACIFSGSATDDSGIASQIGADSLWADGSIYVSVVDGAGKLLLKVNDTWTDQK